MRVIASLFVTTLAAIGCSIGTEIAPPPELPAPNDPNNPNDPDDPNDPNDPSDPNDPNDPIDDELATFTYHRDVAPLLAAKCTQCHSATGIAPFSLDTYDDAALYKDMIADAVETGIMPPFYADPNCNDYVDDPSLSPDELALLRTWSNENAPLGDPLTATPLPTPPALDEATVTTSMPAPYTQLEEPDENRCFLLNEFEVPADRFVTGFRVFPGNTDVVHHILIFLVPPAGAPNLDASPDGFACNGGMIAQEGGGLIGAWAPGGLGADMPDGLGVAIEPGSRLVVQMHYNSNKNGPQPDQTSIGLVLSENVEKQATFRFYTDPSWLPANGMPIPAGQVTTHEGQMPGDPVRLARAQSIEIYSVAMHMHLLAVDASLRVNHADGSESCLLDLERWDFNWQMQYHPVDPVVLLEGDRLLISCTWDNTGEGAVDANWGEGTTQEMCLAALLVVINE